MGRVGGIIARVIAGSSQKIGLVGFSGARWPLMFLGKQEEEVVRNVRLKGVLFFEARSSRARSIFLVSSSNKSGLLAACAVNSQAQAKIRLMMISFELPASLIPRRADDGILCYPASRSAKADASGAYYRLASVPYVNVRRNTGKHGHIRCASAGTSRQIEIHASTDFASRRTIDVSAHVHTSAFRFASVHGEGKYGER